MQGILYKCSRLTNIFKYIFLCVFFLLLIIIYVEDDIFASSTIVIYNLKFLNW